MSGLFVLFIVIVVNWFPNGYVLSGEDLFQHINLKEQYRQLFYDWQGRASLYYAVFFLLDFLGISETAQLSWYLGIFLIASYGSFLIFIRLVFGKVEEKIAVAGALFYALNLYTLYVFTYTWGYSDFQILYAFIPILTGTYIVFLKSRNNFFGAAFLLILFFASMGFTNPAFAVSFTIYIIFLTIVMYLTRIIQFEFKELARLTVLGFFSLLVSAYWIFPVVPQVSRGVADIAETNSINLVEWLQKTSNPISETIRLGQFNSGSFFPRNNPYLNLNFIKPLVIALSFLPILMIIAGYWKGPELQGFTRRRLFIMFLGLFVLFIALNARVRIPFDTINNFLFQLPGLNTLRSYEKIAIFTPFILAVLFVLTLLRPWTGRIRRLIIAAMVIVLLLPLPFYTGKLQQNMSFILSQRSKDYTKSSHSFLVKIPEEYYAIRKVINEDHSDFKIASLPYNTDKRGWVSYPKWKLRGSDITASLYKAPLINPNAIYVGDWLFATDFNERDDDPIWIIKLLGMLNVKYVIFHKDVHDEFVDKSKHKIEYLVSKGSLLEMDDNEYFTLYRMKDEYLAPYVYMKSSRTSIKPSIDSILLYGDAIRTSWRAVEYRALNPKKIIATTGLTYGQDIVLSERYDPLWNATYHGPEGRRSLDRDPLVTYANAWRLDDDMDKGSVTIEYLPMKYFYIGFLISTSIVFLVIIYFIHYFYARRRKSE